MKQTYKILWDNGHASGTLPGTFTNKRAAERAGAAWKREMVAMDDNPYEAREAYEWEIINADENTQN